MKTKTNTGMDMLCYGLYAFGALGLEILIMMVEESLYGSASSWTTIQQIAHWCLTILVWGGIGCSLLRHRPIEQTQAISMQEKGLLGLLIVIAIGYTSFVWNGCKPWIELETLGPLRFLFQYLYYAMESFLIFLILVFGQHAMKLWLKKDTRIPFGGILLALTWGLIHILTQGMETGIYTVVLSLLYGSFYCILQKNHTIAYLGIAFLFMV